MIIAWVLSSCHLFWLTFTGQSPKTSKLERETVGTGHSQHTTSWGTRGGVRYFDEDADEEDFKVERKRPKRSPKVSSSKHDVDSRASSSRSPVGQRTTPPSRRTVTTPTKDKNAQSAPIRTQTTPTTSKAGRGTTPKKSTPQPGPSPSSTVGSVSGSGTTPSMSRAQSFLRYKNRAGPRAPGSKEIPEGNIHCTWVSVQCYFTCEICRACKLTECALTCKQCIMSKHVTRIKIMMWQVHAAE